MDRGKAFGLATATLVVMVAWLLLASRNSTRCRGPGKPGGFRIGKYDLFGGWKRGRVERRGFFHLAERGGVWWLVDPLGCLFISKGVNHVDPRGDYSPPLGYSPYQVNVEKRYGDFGGWLEATVSRLKSWGFNTVGAWSYGELSLH
ncbi:MAG TPA: hypothetical protein ENG30_00940, partial [Thermofilaceae archaeon]|nr:hypothetical protein [Thermofilaceae archaeon]